MTRLHVPVRPDLELMDGYHSPQVAVQVRLNTNESPYPPPPGWRDALAEEIARIPFHRYPDRSASDLRAAIAGLHGVRPDQVLVGNGSNEVLQALCLTYGGADRCVAVFEPTYALHSHIARLTGTKVAVGERHPDLTLDLDEVRRVLSSVSPVLTYLCSPNNPTGLVEPREVIEAVVALAPGLVVVDEAYGEFAPWSALSSVCDDWPLVVTRTFSKTWSMAAMRLGYLVGPAEVVSAVQSALLPYHLDAVKQAAGRLALQYGAEMEARVATLVEERGRLQAALAGMEVDAWPSGANFVLFRPRRRDADEVWQALLDRSVLVRNCSAWPRLPGCLRVTVGTPEENAAFLGALAEALR